MLCSSEVFGYQWKYIAHELMDGESTIPASVNMACYHCCHQFSGPPVVDEQIYCSWSCRKADLMDHISYHSNLQLQELPVKARQRNGIITPIKPSPDRCSLRMFGGPLSIEEFRAIAANQSMSTDVARGTMITERMLHVIKTRQSDTEGFHRVFGPQTLSVPSSGMASGDGEAAAAPAIPLFDQLAAEAGMKTAPRSALSGLMTKRKPRVR